MEINNEYNEQITKILTEHNNGGASMIFCAKRYRYLKDYVMQFTEQFPDLPFQARLYFVLHDIHEYVKCCLDDCDNEIPHDRRCHPFNGYASLHCSISCSQRDPEYRKELEARSITRCGKPNINQTDEYRERASKRMLSHDDEWWDDVIAKRRATCTDKYGVDAYTKTDAYVQQMGEIWDNKTEEEIQAHVNKIKKTKKDRYGDENYINSDKARETRKKHKEEDSEFNAKSNAKREQTCLDKYGVTHVAQAEEFKQKAIETSRKNYGTDYPTQAQVVKDKIMQTTYEHLGVYHPAQCPEVFSKQCRKLEWNGIAFDTVPELAYYIWLTDHGIKFKYQDIDPISFEFNGKTSYYHPDFLLLETNQIVEIKGDQFFRPDGTMFCPYRRKEWSDEKYQEVCDLYEAKHQCMITHSVKILRQPDYQQYIDYLKTKYTWQEIKSFRRKTNKRPKKTDVEK